MLTLLRWAPAAILAAGTLLVAGVEARPGVPLPAPLGTSVPASIAGYRGSDLEIPAEERAVAGMTEYVMRTYERPEAPGGAAGAFSLYVGYYASQTQGRTIHSPKNCLPGAGWEVLRSDRRVVRTGAGPLEVNRYFLQRGKERALAVYWYQGRGRTEADEYAVKWHLLRDALLRGRSDEALVRVIVPLEVGEEAAFGLAARVARTMVPVLNRALPS